MMHLSNARLVQRFYAFSTFASIFSIFVGLSGLYGSAFHIRWLTTWFVEPVTMKVNTAACFVLLGSSLWLRRRRGCSFATRLAGQALAAWVCLAGFLSWIEYSTGIDLTIDHWLLHPLADITTTAQHPGPMSPITGLTFLAAGTALIALDWRTKSNLWPAEMLSGFAAMGSSFGGINLFVQSSRSEVSLAIPTAVTFCVLSAGILMSRSEWSFGSLWTSPGEGARWLRRSIPGAMVGLLVFGALLSKPMLTAAHFTWLEAAVIALAAAVLVIAFVVRTDTLLDRSESRLRSLEPASQIPADRLAFLTDAYGDSSADSGLRRWAITGITVGLILGALGGFDSLRSLRQASENDDSVAHTHAVSAALNATLAHAVDIETGTRGFAATGDPMFLETEESAKLAIPGDLDRLRSLAADNTTQQQRLLKLESQIHARISLGEQNAAYRRRTGRVPDSDRFRRGKECMDRIRAAVAEMQDDESHLLAQRLNSQAVSRQRTVTILLVTTLLGIGMLVFAGFVVLREIRRASMMRAQVLALNSELESRVAQRTIELRESEQRVRRKLDSILLPETDLGALELADVLDIEVIRDLLSDFHSVVHATTALLDVRGNILVAVGWQDICTKFHRVNPESCRNCRESDLELSAGVGEAEFKIYKCKNLMWDVSTPVMVGGHHAGNLFCGQFFFADEPIDYAAFRAQAKKYGFNEEGYLAAVDRVPRLSREEVNASMTFLTRLAKVISHLSYSGVQLARSSSQLSLANAGLAAANQELEAFTYSVSHDLRAPLRHISGFSKILSEEFRPVLPAEAQLYIDRISDGTRRMGLLVDDLLNLGRIGRQGLQLQTTGLRALVDEVIADFHPECVGRQIEWKLGDLPFVDCDPGLLKQVLQNLIANALKFTRPRSLAVIEIGQKTDDGAPVIYVRDNGVGFSMKYADKLFGVFQRLHRQEDFEGTGVGLATSQRIVQKHGGQIWAKAELDKGATFYFTLAARNAKSAAGKSASVGGTP